MKNLIEKNTSESIECLEKFFERSFYEVRFEHPSIDKSVVKTVKKDKGLFFEFAKMILSSQKDGQKLFDKDDEIIEFADFYSKLYFKINSCSDFKFSVGNSGYTTVSGYINNFTTNNLEKFQKGFYRAIIIIDEKDFNLSSFVGSKYSLKVKNTEYASGVIESTIKNQKLHLFKYFDEITKKTYFIIENYEQSNYNDFSSVLDEIILGITYLTGTFIGNDIYILGSSKNDFKENSVLSLKSFFDELKSGNMAIPNIMTQHQVNVPATVFGDDNFGKFIEELCNSLTYKRTILLLCQAHTEPHYIKSSLYSVALETITNEISPLIEKKCNPIPSKALSRKIRANLKCSLAKFKTKLTDGAMIKITSDIDRINSPTNKQKLLSPFEYYKISLKQVDIDAIANRNDFLHGRIPESTDRHLLPIISGRLLFCVNSLILKRIGYEGNIMYHSVMYQLNNKLSIDELPIRKI